jgi:hypothetical protein
MSHLLEIKDMKSGKASHRRLCLGQVLRDMRWRKKHFKKRQLYEFVHRKILM